MGKASLSEQPLSRQGRPYLSPFFNSWVMFEEFVIDRVGLWHYMPFLPCRYVLRLGCPGAGGNRPGAFSPPATDPRGRMMRLRARDEVSVTAPQALLPNGG